MPQEALFARGAHSMQAAMRRALLRRGRSGNTASVSYTHLDVYKRQESYIPIFVIKRRKPIAVTCVGITSIAMINVNAAFFNLKS